MIGENELLGLIDNLQPGDVNLYENSYLDSIKDVLESALTKHQRLIAFRFDLRYPSDHYYALDEFDNPAYSRRSMESAITRFAASLKAKISAHLSCKRRQGIRIYGTGLFYVWCREINRSDNEHYHFLLMLNHDEYHTLGEYGEDNLSALITDAWMSATGITRRQAARCIYFVRKHRLKQKKDNFEYHLQKLFNDACYLAKKETKQYGSRRKNFGTSRPFHEAYLN